MNEEHRSALPEDPGEPVTELKELQELPLRGFLRSLRNRIGRRVLATQALELSVPILAGVFLEYLSMIFALFSPGESRPPVQREQKKP